MFSTTIRIEQTIEIQKSIIEMQHVILDFEEWKHWSPWECMEPKMTVRISGDGKSVGTTSAWEGTYMGTGEMERTLVSSTKIEQEIRFKKPFSSKASTFFQLEMLPYSVTKVTWVMETKLPFFLFFLKPMMERMLAMDFQRGLRLMKEYVETGTVPAHLEKIEEDIVKPEMYYVRVDADCTLETLHASMQGACQQLEEIIEKEALTPVGPMMMVYHRADVMKNVFHYSAAYPISKEAADVLEKNHVGYLQATQGVSAFYKGAYRFLDIPWTAVTSYLRFYHKKQKKGMPSLEIYHTTPLEAEDKDLMTEIYIPIS